MMKRIRQLPKGWRTVKLRSLLRRYTTKGCPDWPLLSVTREQGVILRNTESKEENHNYIPDDLSKYKAVEEGDFVINKMKAWQGSYGFSPCNGIVSPAYYTYHFASDEVLPAFFHVALRSRAYVDSFAAVSKGIRIGQWDMDENKMREIAFSIPSLAEQARIVSYLDSKSSAIDALVERREQVIAHLQELKQSIIAHAVTKGLNPDTPTKDSGESWLGHVPAHWSTVQLRSLFAEHRKKNRGMQEKNLLSLSYGRIVAKDMEMAKGLVPRNYEGYNIVEADDIVLRLTDLQNDHKSLRTGLVTQRGIVTSAYLTLRKKAELNSAYMHYLLHVFDVKKAIYGMGNGVRQMINFGEMGRLSLLFPPIEEQASIVAYLDHKCVEIDALVARHRAMIERLKELKTSLIAAAVTGKIDVR